MVLADNNNEGDPLLEKLLNIFKLKEQQDFRGLYTDASISFAEEFPEIPEPESKHSPIFLSTQWTLGDLHCEDMPSLAVDLLEEGIDTPSIRRLAGEMNVACIADIEPLVRRMFHELDVIYPLSETEVLIVYSRQVAREVIHGKRNAWAAASHLAKGIWPRNQESPDIRDLSELLDALDWNAVNHNMLPKLTEELIEVFARLGARTDREKRCASLGCLQGQGWIADDFNAPLPDDLQALFDGRDEPSVG